MTLEQRQAADFPKIHKAMKSPVIEWEGEEYRCIPSGRSESKKLVPGGLDIEADFVCKLLKSDFSNGEGPFPKAKESITFQGTEFKAEKVVINESDVFLKIFCISGKK